MWIISSIVQQYRWWCMCPWNLREETKDWSLVSKDFISFTIFVEPASILKTPCLIASPCLFDSLSWKQLNAICIEFKPIIWLWIFMVLSLVLGSGSLASSRVLGCEFQHVCCLCEPLIMGVQQLEDFSGLCIQTCMLGLTNWVWGLTL